MTLIMKFPPDMPCAGTFIFRPALAEPILREWWDYNMPSKNFKHFHEQVIPFKSNFNREIFLF